MRKWPRRYRADLIIACIGLLAMLLLFGAEIWLYRYASYWEGRGYVPHGAWFFLVPVSYFLGVPFLIAFGARLLIRIREDPVGASFARLLSGIALTVAPSPICSAGLDAATSLPMPHEAGIVRFARGFRDRIDKRCGPEEVRDWAESILKEHGPRSVTFTLPEDRIPRFIKKIYPTGPLREHVRGSTQDGVVEVFWGSPLPGHWGLAIGPESMVRKEGLSHDEGEDICRFRWKPGIYIWHTEN